MSKHVQRLDLTTLNGLNFLDPTVMNKVLQAYTNKINELVDAYNDLNNPRTDTPDAFQKRAIQYHEQQRKNYMKGATYE